jgi:hypothetical protein
MTAIKSSSLLLLVCDDFKGFQGRNPGIILQSPTIVQIGMGIITEGARQKAQG